MERLRKVLLYLSWATHNWLNGREAVVPHFRGFCKLVHFGKAQGLASLRADDEALLTFNCLAGR